MTPPHQKTSKSPRPFDLGVTSQQWARISTSHLSPPMIWASHSGGPDSTALVYALNQWVKDQKTRGSTVSWGLCHINYQLRGQDSDLDARFSKDLADFFEVPFQLLKVSHAPKTGIQNWARSIRRQFWHDLVCDGGVVALGHHLDDVAENVLFRMARGTSVGSLAGMKFWTPPLWRPLLGYTKAELIHWLAEWSANYRKDLSNESPRYARNRIRREILPILEELFPGAGRRIAELALEAQNLHGPTMASDKRSADQINTFATKLKGHYQTLDSRPLQLSRAWLREVVSQQNRPQKNSTPLKIQIPGGKAVLNQVGSEMCVERSHESFMKPALRQQMQQTLSAPSITCYLPSGAAVYGVRDLLDFNKSQKVFVRISNSTINPRKIRIETIPHQLTFCANHRKMRIKDLFRLWKIPPPQRCRWRIVTYDGNVSCLSDGLLFWEASCPTFELRNLTSGPIGPDESAGVSSGRIESDPVGRRASVRPWSYQVINVLTPNSR